VDQAVVVGHSAGGGTALELYRRSAFCCMHGRSLLNLAVSSLNAINLHSGEVYTFYAPSHPDGQVSVLCILNLFSETPVGEFTSSAMTAQAWPCGCAGHLRRWQVWCWWLQQCPPTTPRTAGHAVGAWDANLGWLPCVQSSRCKSLLPGMPTEVPVCAGAQAKRVRSPVLLLAGRCRAGLPCCHSRDQISGHGWLIIGLDADGWAWVALYQEELQEAGRLCGAGQPEHAHPAKPRCCAGTPKYFSTWKHRPHTCSCTACLKEGTAIPHAHRSAQGILGGKQHPET
jgi:hypothetical protein